MIVYFHFHLIANAEEGQGMYKELHSNFFGGGSFFCR